MSREYAPGQVALVTWTALGVSRTDLRFRYKRKAVGWVWESPEGDWIGDASAKDVRPLVTLDLDGKRLARCLRIAADAIDNGRDGYELEAQVLREASGQIEAQTRPPKPPEPSGIGAVVEDAGGTRWIKVDEHGDCNDWVRFGAPSHDDPEQATGRSVRWFYRDIDAVRVLSEGVPSC